METTINDQMLQVAEEKDLNKADAEEMVREFRSMVSIDDDVVAEALAIVVTNETQIEEMAAAREMRLDFRTQRIAVKAHRKEKKEHHLRAGQVIDGMAKCLVDLIEPLEAHLAEQENFVKIAEEKREAERLAKAEALLKEQEEKERLEKEAEDKRVREENEKLRAEAAVRDQKEQEARAEQQKITDEKAAKARADAERSRQAAVQREREKNEAEAEKREALHKEELRKAREVTCPKCGHTFENV